MQFKKIVSDLSFSPSVMGKLSMLARKVKKEEAVRKTGVILILLTVTIQLFLILSPFTPSNSADNLDMISRGYGIDYNCVKNEDIYCTDNIIISHTVSNLSQGNINASSTEAKPGDYISYMLTIKNNSQNSVTITPNIRIADILEYSTIVDANNSVLNTQSNILAWPTTTLDPSTAQTKSFTVSLLNSIPVTAQGDIYKESHDCVMTSYFGNSTNINIDCPIVKKLENSSHSLPTTNTLHLILAPLLLTVLILTSYIRTRQIKREIKIIRQNAIAGSL